MVETYVSADNFLPIKYSLVQRESNKDVDDLQLFDQEERKTYLFYKRLKKKNNQTNKVEKEAYITKYYQDFISVMVLDPSDKSMSDVASSYNIEPHFG